MSESKPIIRIASEKDALVLSEIGINTFNDTFHNIISPQNMSIYLHQSFNQEKICDEIVRGRSIYFLAFIDKLPVGYAKLNKDKGIGGLKEVNVIELERIYVLQEMIGKKIGTYLMETILDIVSKEKYKILWLTVWENNRKAIEFYIKWGFKKSGNYIYKVGAADYTNIIMTKDLQSKFKSTGI